jgi:hypothetical protein
VPFGERISTAASPGGGPLVASVTREWHGVLGDDGDDGRDALLELHGHDVAVGDVREFVGEDALVYRESSSSLSTRMGRPSQCRS